MLIAVLAFLLIGVTIVLLLSEQSGISVAVNDSQNERTRLEYLTEAGLAHATWHLRQTTSCENYTNLPTTTFGADSYNATIAPTSGSPVAINISGTLANGTTRNVLRTEVKAYAAPATIALQPAGEAIDTFIEGDPGHHDHNKETDKDLKVDPESGKEYFTLFQFDLSALPMGSTVYSAELELYMNSGVGAAIDINVHRLTRDWTESGATWLSYDGSNNWTTPGGDYDAAVAASLNVAGTGWYSVDIGGLVDGWLNGQFANQGLILVPPSAPGNKEKRFTSSDDDDASLHPKLTITYACECGTSCDAGLGPLAHWKLDETGGNTAADSEGGHDGTVSGATWTAGTDNGALLFDGSNDRVNLTSDAQLDDVFEGGATVMAWINPDNWGESDSGRVLDKTDSTSGNRDGWAIGLDGNDASLAFVQGFSGDNGYWVTAEDSIRRDVWQHIAVVYDASSTGNDPAVYIDGVSQALIESSSPAGSLRSDAALNLTLGNYAQGTNRTFDGMIDDVRIYPRLLSESEINDIVTPPGPEPLAHWMMDDGAGPTAIDSVGGHDGTLLGPLWVAGRVDGALHFDGADDVVEVPHASTLSLSTQFTIAAWVRNESPIFGSTHRIISKEATGSSDSYWLGLQGMTLWTGIGGGFYSSSTVLVPDTWYHVAVSFDDDADELILYVNGTAETISTSTSLTANTAPVRIGANWESGKYWHGLLDDVRIYDTVLSAAQIASLALTGIPGPGGGDLTGGEGPDAACGTYRDEFNVESYGSNDGTLTWSTDWLEINESNGWDSGDERVVDEDSEFHLQVRDNDGGGEGVQREADLSAGTAATLSFDYRRDGFDNGNDYVTVDVSSNGGSSWTELDRIAGPGTDSNYVSVSYDISAHLSANTRIRFLTSPSHGSGDELYVDNVEISLSGCTP